MSKSLVPTAVTAPLLAAYHTKNGRGRGSLVLLRLMNRPGRFVSFHQGTMTLVLRYNGFTLTLNTKSNCSSGTSCDGAASWITPAQFTTTSRRSSKRLRAVERIWRHDDSSVMSAVKAWQEPAGHNLTVCSASAPFKSTARTRAPSRASFSTIYRRPGLRQSMS